MRYRRLFPMWADIAPSRYLAGALGGFLAAFLLTRLSLPPLAFGSLRRGVCRFRDRPVLYRRTAVQPESLPNPGYGVVAVSNFFTGFKSAPNPAPVNEFRTVTKRSMG